MNDLEITFTNIVWCDQFNYEWTGYRWSIAINVFEFWSFEMFCHSATTLNIANKNSFSF